MEEWIDYLRIQGLVSMEQRQELFHMHRSHRPSVVNKALEFANRMRQEHPDLWLGFRGKQRVLGLSK
jgi:hypothetical protein